MSGLAWITRCALHLRTVLSPYPHPQGRRTNTLLRCLICKPTGGSASSPSLGYCLTCAGTGTLHIQRAGDRASHRAPSPISFGRRAGRFEIDRAWGDAVRDGLCLRTVVLVGQSSAADRNAAGGSASLSLWSRADPAPQPARNGVGLNRARGRIGPLRIKPGLTSARPIASIIILKCICRLRPVATG